MATSSRTEDGILKKYLKKIQHSVTTPGMHDTALSKISKWYKDKRDTEEPIIILIIGQTGSGKSTLVNNLVGSEVAPVSDDVETVTLKIEKYSADLHGVKLIIYDTPELLDSQSEEENKKYYKEIKSAIAQNFISLAIFCFNITEIRLKHSILETFQRYNTLGIQWEKVVVTLTFADRLAHDKNPLSVHADKWEKAIRNDVLIKELHVPQNRVDKIQFRPATWNPDSKLPGKKEWFVPLWFSVLDVLEPKTMLEFLHLRNRHLSRTRTSPEEQLMSQGQHTLETLVNEYETAIGTKVKKLILRSAQYLGYLDKEKDVDSEFEQESANENSHGEEPERYGTDICETSGRGASGKNNSVNREQDSSVEKTSAEEACVYKTSRKETDGDKTDGSKMGREEISGKETDRSETGREETSGKETDGDKTDGSETGREETSGGKRRN
jgi:GTPase SAR1 family protein